MSDWRVEENYHWGKMLDVVDTEENRIEDYRQTKEVKGRVEG